MAKKVTLENLNRKLDAVLSNQKKLLKEEAEVEEEEREELKELRALEEFEREIKEEVGEHPLRTLTYRDVAKGSIGAFIAVGGHFTFFYGVKVAAEIDVVRATLLFPISYGLGAVFMYLTGFRRIKDPKLMSFLPIRLTVLYMTAIVTAMLVLLLFNPSFLFDFETTYKQIATVTLSAVIGACTADLIGKE